MSEDGTVAMHVCDRRRRYVIESDESVSVMVYLVREILRLNVSALACNTRYC